MTPAVIKMYETNWWGDCKRAKKFLAEHRIAYDFIDVDQDAGALRIVEQTNAGKRIIPTIFFPDRAVLVEPSNAGRKIGPPDEKQDTGISLRLDTQILMTCEFDASKQLVKRCSGFDRGQMTTCEIGVQMSGSGGLPSPRMTAWRSLSGCLSRDCAAQ